MKVNIYKRNYGDGNIYVMSPANSRYSTLRSAYRRRTIFLPKHVCLAIMKSSRTEQLAIAKTLYKGLR